VGEYPSTALRSRPNIVLVDMRASSGLSTFCTGSASAWPARKAISKADATQPRMVQYAATPTEWEEYSRERLEMRLRLSFSDARRDQ
jgi:hypothetical protein